jgi:hypothetical protein
MIRRGFWLTTGAVTGIVAYRRVSMVGRRLSGHLNLDTSAKTGTGRRPASPVLSVRHTRRGAIRAARETYRFTRDVREGMALYLAQTPRTPKLPRPGGPEGPTLSTNHDAQPEDGY